MNHVELLGRLVLELEDPQWNFRTVPGLASSLGIPEREVKALLERYSRLVRWMPASDDQGNQLLIGSFRRTTIREAYIRVRAYMAHSYA